MASDPAPTPLPSGPVSYAEVKEILPTIRQSLLATFDSCPLQALFEMRHAWNVTTHPAAVGILFHRFAAEALKTLQATGNRQIPTQEAMEILYEVMLQRDVPEYDRVHVPSRELPKLRLAVLKFSKDQSFSIERLVAVERRLFAEIPVVTPDGGIDTRTFSGQVDALSFDPPDGAIILDWKTGWSLPPEPRFEEEEFAWSETEAQRRLSWQGYFQQRAYGLLVLKAYSNLERVTLREVYVLRNQVREATIYRADLEHVERELGWLIQGLDRAIMAGPKHAGTGNAKDPWPTSPGKQCSYCPKPHECPVDPDYRTEGAIKDADDAARFAAEFQVADRLRTHRREALKTYCEIHGQVPLKDAKGRRVIGFNIKPDGSQSFGVFTPEASDKGSLAPDLEDSRLEEALRESTAEAEKQRSVRKRKKRDALV